MRGSEHIVASARSYVKQLLKAELPGWVLYHNHRHTEETVRSVKALGSLSELSKANVEILVLAAWFHDTGFVKSAAGHERIGASIAAEFLRHHQYPDRSISKVTSCILSTKMPRKPRNTLERILCDADLSSLGKRSFFRQNEALRGETEARKRRSISEEAWLRRTLHFLEHARFLSRAGRALYEDQRRANLRKLRRILHVG